MQAPIYEHLNQIVADFLKKAGDPVPMAACFAIAGPVQNDQCKLTNLNWELNARDMETELGIKNIRLINDFAAVGYGISALQPKDIVSLQEPDDLEVLQDQPATSKELRAVLGQEQAWVKL